MQQPRTSVRIITGKRAAQERAAQLASSATTAASAASAAAPSERTDASGATATGQLVPRAETGPKRFTRQQVPDEVLLDAALNQAIAVLPANYNFEVSREGSAVFRMIDAHFRVVTMRRDATSLFFESRANSNKSAVLNTVSGCV